MARGHHDVGGLPGAGPVDQSEHVLSDWEILADAVNQALGVTGVKRTDEMRRAREETPNEQAPARPMKPEAYP